MVRQDPQLLISWLALFLSCCHCFYVPGWSPQVYRAGDSVPLWLNKVSSERTHLPYAYSELPGVCQPTTAQTVSLNLGEILRGDRISKSDYELRMGEDVECAHLCDVSLDQASAKQIYELIHDEYLVEWIVDNLPGATSFVTVDRKKKYYGAGFKFGTFENNKAFIHNHVTLVLKYRPSDSDPSKRLIVAFEVYPKSINGPIARCPKSLDNNPAKEIDLDLTTSVTYTYSVYWREDNTIQWHNRWDLFFVNSDPKIHWYGIFNSVIIVGILSIIIGVIVLRTINRDIEVYNDIDKVPEGHDEVTGWKLVHGDVFRSPSRAHIFAPLIGSGVQLLCMIFSVLVLAAVGILNPSYRGGFMSFALFLFVFAGIFSGYLSSRLFKQLGGSNWKPNAIRTAALVPGVALSSVLGLNFLLVASGSSAALPSGTILALLCMWLLLLFPLVYIGAWVGEKRPIREYPRRTNVIPRQTPSQPWYLKTVSSVLIGGAVPFFVSFIELLFILKSAWQDQSTFYYMWGFTGVSFALICLSVIEVTIVIVYFMLCAENYHWFWRSFLVGAASSVYIFVYSTWYMLVRLNITGFLPVVVFLFYSLLACFVHGLICGTLGFLGAYAFVWRIYASLKAD